MGRVPFEGLQTDRQGSWLRTGERSGSDERTTEHVTRDVDEKTAKAGRLATELTIQQTSSSRDGHGTQEAQLDKRRHNEHGRLTDEEPGSPISQLAARPVSDRLTGTIATRDGNDGWPPGNGRASKKRASDATPA